MDAGDRRANAATDTILALTLDDTTTRPAYNTYTMDLYQTRTNNKTKRYKAEAVGIDWLESN